MCNIKLQAAGLNRWLDDMEQRLTLVRDLLDVMEAEAEQLKTVWESGAEEIWKAEFQIRVSGVRMQLAEMKQALTDIGKAGKTLANIEMRMVLTAKKL